MKKDKTITDFISKLKRSIDLNLLEIVDLWESDLCAIGLRKGNKIFYISTYNYFDKQEIKYDYDLEIIHTTKKDELEIVRLERGVSEIALIDAIKDFFQI